jgi:hypothetical protein
MGGLLGYKARPFMRKAWKQLGANTTQVYTAELRLESESGFLFHCVSEMVKRKKNQKERI